MVNRIRRALLASLILHLLLFMLPLRFPTDIRASHTGQLRLRITSSSTGKSLPNPETSLSSVAHSGLDAPRAQHSVTEPSSKNEPSQTSRPDRQNEDQRRLTTLTPSDKQPEKTGDQPGRVDPSSSHGRDPDPTRPQRDLLQLEPQQLGRSGLRRHRQRQRSKPKHPKQHVDPQPSSVVRATSVRLPVRDSPPEETTPTSPEDNVHEPEPSPRSTGPPRVKIQPSISPTPLRFTETGQKRRKSNRESIQPTLLSGGKDTRKPRHRPLPGMPAWLEKRGESKRVEVEFVIDRSGKIDSTIIRRSSGIPRLDRRVLRSLKQWRYDPGARETRNVVFHFQLHTPGPTSQHSSGRGK